MQRVSIIEIKIMFPKVVELSLDCIYQSLSKQTEINIFCYNNNYYYYLHVHIHFILDY